MNIKFIKKGLLVLSVVFMGSCSKDFLEVLPSEFISSDQMKEESEFNPDIQAGSMNGIYSMMYTPGTGGTSSHDDFGQRGWDIYTDMLCSDMALAGVNYGWYSGIARYNSTIDFTSTDNYKPWRYYYRIIQGANTVIDGLGGNDAVLEDETSKHYMGQAKAMRAYAYFYLANLFATDYNPSEPILPIYDNITVPNQPKSTTEEVYILITSDLEEAIGLLEGFNRTAKNQVNQDVAKGLLAYAYAAMGNYTKVIEYTDDLINAGYPIMSKEEVVYNPKAANDVAGFNNINTPGWMWGVDLTIEIGLDLVSWWGQVDYFTYSYAGAGDYKVMDEGLYNAIDDKDIRKQQFPAGYLHMPVNKFYSPDRQVMGQRNVTTDYVYMRISEMYLLNAEAKAKVGSEDQAKEVLKLLLKERYTDDSYVSYIDGLSGKALEDEIYLQTRIELWGEGKSYLAMKRNRATITRGSNHIYYAGKKFNYNDDELTFEIPQSEIQNNPHIN